MIDFTFLTAHGARRALLSGVAEGDCGWGGVEAGRRAAFLRTNGLDPEGLVAVRQCHGDTVLAVSAKDAGRSAGPPEGALGDADGLMTGERGIPLGVTVADCVPVLLACDVAVAVVHAGREGTSLGISRRAVEQLCATYGVPAGALYSVIGPSAGPCCYEVSREMASNWVQNGMVAKGRYLDLWETNRQQLLSAGMQSAHISVTRHCTICQPGFFSYRGMQTSERNLAVIQR